ncbi:hypothetical protein IU479_07180 [Nocardia abscessus]|uniref:hypothetical protein n=1 Tax=Nocardia abscessus TaxID=120957 RepID=UPI001895498E|nr:hypothetical protein [Nocardia abscessus]MBF6217890.1 hypothetical protein [Nocardia abscessus]
MNESVLFTINLDEGRLPVDIDVSRNIHGRLEPPDLSAAAITGNRLPRSASDDFNINSPSAEWQAT